MALEPSSGLPPHQVSDPQTHQSAHLTPPHPAAQGPRPGEEGLPAAICAPEWPAPGTGYRLWRCGPGGPSPPSAWSADLPSPREPPEQALEPP